MQSDHFGLLVLSKFPYPVAQAFRTARDQKDSREAACVLFQLLLEHLGQVLVAEYLSRDDRDAELVQELSKLLQRAPSIGTWLDWIHRIAKTYDGESETFFFGASEGLVDKSFRSEMEYLLERRNRWAHSSAQFNVDDFRGRLFHVMERLRAVHQAPLFALQSASVSGQLNVYKAKRLQGDNPHLAEIECRSSSSLDTGRVFTYGQATGEVLSLHPFILYAPCEQCSEQHYFQYSRPRKRKIVLASVPEGHEITSTEAYDVLERYFRRARPLRERPRHFTVPGEFAGVPRTLREGDSVGAYRVEELIKIGGMAQVYRATDTRTGKEFALKLLPLEFTRDSVLLMRFEEEAHNLKLLEHPNIVALHDFGEDFGDHYLVLDLAHGGPIGNQRCRDLSELRKPLPEADILHIGKQVCEALSYVHSRGITHRDLKPGNVVVSGDKCQITDFGIARSKGEMSMTLTGLPVGTPEYMSPEQVQQGDVDRRSDIYAIGCILYELAAGRPPYRADTPLTTALYHVQASPPRLEDLNPRISRGLRNIIYKALQKRPEHRYQCARALYDDLQAARKDPAGPQVIEGNKTPQDALEEVRAREQAKFRRRLVAACVGFAMFTAVAFAGRSVYINWRVSSLVAQARGLWQDGIRDGERPRRGEEVCKLIKQAWLTSPDHQQLNHFLSQISTEGTLIVNVAGASAELAIEPDPKTAKRFDLNFAPRVITPGGPVFRAGEKIRLMLGHYWVTVKQGGVSSDPLPVCITQIRYRETSTGWLRDRRLIPDEITPWKTGEDRFESLAFAEEFVIEDLKLPREVPPGFAYVNPGPFFSSKIDMEQERSLPDDNCTILEEYAFEEDYLEDGFLMAKLETTVRDFETWFKKRWDGYFEWKIREDRVHDELKGWTNFRKLRETTQFVPFDLQLTYWKERLTQKGVNLQDVQQDKLFEFLFEDELDEHREVWSKHGETTRFALASEEEKNAPVGFIYQSLARAFARTHQPIRVADFRVWLDEQIEWLESVVQRLGELQSQIRTDGDQQYVPADVLPSNLLLEEFETDRQPVFVVYYNFLYYHAFYAAQLPTEEILRWASQEERLDPEIRRRLPMLREWLSMPHQWILEPIDGSMWLKRLLLVYAEAIENGRIPIHKGHFLAWLDTKVREERHRIANLNGHLARLNASGNDENDEVEGIPWELRLEYGRDRGWDLPSIRQWEKAFRGADARRFVWDSKFNEAATSMGRPTVHSAFQYDCSPYGIYSLGANLSEWVLPNFAATSRFLKGGNYHLGARSCNGGYLIRTDARHTSRWAGIRVVREIRD